MHYLNFQTVLDKPISDGKANIYQYSIANQIYQSDKKIEQLGHLIQKPLLANKLVQNPYSQICSNNQQIIYNDKVWIGERNYSTQVVYSEESTYGFKFDLQKYTVNKNSISINIPTIDPTILLGPVLITHLAQNKVFCFHASAFLLNNQAFVLMGDSGTGKSTIARIIDNQQQCKRFSDDILPIKIVEGSITLLPQFPQLKLLQTDQYQGDNIAKETIFLFAKKSKEITHIKPVDSFSAIKKLIKHSVATKLFAKNELQNHLEFCHKACSRVKSFDVLYQHSQKGLKQLIKQLNEIC